MQHRLSSTATIRPAGFYSALGGHPNGHFNQYFVLLKYAVDPTIELKRNKPLPDTHWYRTKHYAPPKKASASLSAPAPKKGGYGKGGGRLKKTGKNVASSISAFFELSSEEMMPSYPPLCGVSQPPRPRRRKWWEELDM